MIRYDIYSNVANSDQGLQGFPALQELAENLRLEDIETRFVRHSQREEGEINLASSQFARGVKVRGTAVKIIPSEASIKGLLNWTRTVLARVDRGLHLDIEKVRQSNAGPLAIASVLPEERQVFISGLDGPGWARLTTPVDLTFKAIPAALDALPEVKAEYLARRTRPASFFPLLQAIANLNLLPADLQAQVAQLAQARDPAGISALTEPQVIGLGQVYDAIDRYQKVVEGFVELVGTAEATGELPPLFELLTLDVPFDLLREKLLPFALEAKRGRVEDKRQLIAEVRIGLGNAPVNARADLQSALLGLVMRARLQHDPKTYAAATRLTAWDPEQMGFMAQPRKLFLDLKNAQQTTLAAGAAPGTEAQPNPEQPLPVALKQKLFELIVQLTFQAQYNQSSKDGALPAGVTAARNVLSLLIFDEFSIAQLKTVNPSLPIKGVAKTYAEKVPVTLRELQEIQHTAGQALFPLGAVSAHIASIIRSKFQDADQQRKVGEMSDFLIGGVHLLHLTNYLLGNAGVNALMWQGLLNAGRALGLTVYESRDQVHTVFTPGPGQEEEDLARQGTILLMNQENSRIFPVRSRPELLLGAYRYLFRSQVAWAVRRFLSHRIGYLYTLHGAELFEIIYQHLIWDLDLRLSRLQLGSILLLARVLEAERLKEFGFRGEALPNAAEHENPWLQQVGADGKDTAHPFIGDSIEQRFRTVYNAMVEEMQQSAGSKAASGPPGCKEVLTRMANEEERFFLRNPEVQQALAGSKEAEFLGQLLLEILDQNEETLLAQRTSETALDLSLPGPLAHLTFLKPSYQFTVKDAPVLVRLLAAPLRGPADVDPASRLVAEALSKRMDSRTGTAEGRALAQAVGVLQRHRNAWLALQHECSAVIIDQILRETLLKMIAPKPPRPEDLSRLPEDKVVCLGTSSFNQGKFHRVVTRLDRKDSYFTLSEMSGLLARMHRLREEMQYYRDLIEDIQTIITTLNLSVFDAAYIQSYSHSLAELDQALQVRPEELTPADLQRIQELARKVSKMLREMYDQERSLRLRDRWLSRIIIQLKHINPNIRVNFVDSLWGQAPDAAPGDKPAPEDKPGEGAGAESEPRPKDGKAQEFQTFSVRALQVIDFRTRMQDREVFVISPSNNQKNLTLSLIDQLLRLKGLFAIIFVDTSSAESFAKELRSSLPPHRVFDLNQL